MIVVFDIGNVLLRWDRRYLYAKVFDDEERMERFLATALGMDFVSHTDVAKDFAAAVARRAKSFPEFAKEIQMFHERWIETLGEPIEENVALLRRLRASGKPVYALSNFAHETFALAERKHDFLSEFDDRVISGHVGFVKPDAGIYEILFKRAGRRPNELLFIDNSLRQRARFGGARHAGDPLSPWRRPGERAHCARRPALRRDRSPRRASVAPQSPLKP